MGAPKVTQPFPFFKETEKDPSCCGCNKPHTLITQVQAETQASAQIHDYGTHVVQNNLKVRTHVFDHPVQIGDSYYTHPNNIVNQFESSVPNYKVIK
jgi:hypothetical protein